MLVVEIYKNCLKRKGMRMCKFLENLFKSNPESEDNPIQSKPEDSPESQQEENTSEKEEVIPQCPKPEEDLSGIKVLLDFGHGNNTAGKRSPWSANKVAPELDFYEWKSNREIGTLIYNGLREKGVDVEIIVPEDTDISLKERVARVNAYCNRLGKKNVLLLSVHSNAAGSGKAWTSARGWSAYTTKGQTESDVFAEFLYDEAEKLWNGRNGLKVRKNMSDGDRDQEENFYIIYHTLCPAVLTESFFYDNVEDCKYLLADFGKREIAHVHIQGIIEYIKSKKK